MKNNDLIIFNLHRRYLNISLNYGGFSGIYLVSAFVSENGFEAQAYAGDLVAGKKILDEACTTEKVKAIGLYCDYENVSENIFLSKYIKNKYKLPVIVGGPQATSLGKDFFMKSGCDVLVRYEGELTVLELLQYFLDGYNKLENIRGIAFMKNQKLIINQERDVIENLDLLPFIDKKYSLDNTFRRREASIMTGRGCPFHCAFCHEGHHTRKVRFRSVENVLKEIDLFLKQMPKEGGFILFTDDTFTLMPKRVKELCEGLKERKKKFNFSWFCEGHVHTLYLYPEMIQYMADAGLQRIQLGIETGNQKMLDIFRKGSTVEEIIEVINKCKEAGISQIYGNIIIGGPFYNRTSYLKDLEFARKLLELGQGNVELGVVSYWPLPETSITDNPQKYGLIIKDYNFYTSVSDFPLVETEELSIWDICGLISDMRSNIRTLMLQQLKNNLIPLDLIKNWFEYYWHYNTTGLWFECLASDKLLFNYYECICSGEALPWDAVKEEFLDCHPMRVSALCDHYRMDKENIIVYDVNTNYIEKELIRYSVGKLSVADIINIILEEKGEQDFDKEYLTNKAKVFYQEADKKHLIVFSCY